MAVTPDGTMQVWVDAPLKVPEHDLFGIPDMAADCVPDPSVFTARIAIVYEVLLTNPGVPVIDCWVRTSGLVVVLGDKATKVVPASVEYS
jgi:hypothetical protein